MHCYLATAVGNNLTFVELGGEQHSLLSIVILLLPYAKEAHFGVANSFPSVD